MAEILDLIVIVLLVVTLLYGFVLNKKINVIRESKKELSRLFKSFDDTILKAQTSVAELKQATADASKLLQGNIDRATILADDLSFMSEKAEEVSKNAMQKIDTMKKVTASMGEALAIAEKKNKAQAKRVSMSNQTNGSAHISPEEVKRLRQQSQLKVASDQKAPPRPVKKAPNAAVRSKADKTVALEEILTKIADNNNLANTNDNTKKKTADSGRHKQDVAQALKALGFGKK